MTGTKLKSQGEAFNSWIKEVDNIVSNTQVVTASGDPMEYGDPHFKDQIRRLTACSINLTICQYILLMSKSQLIYFGMK